MNHFFSVQKQKLFFLLWILETIFQYLTISSSSVSGAAAGSPSAFLLSTSQ